MPGQSVNPQGIAGHLNERRNAMKEMEKKKEGEYDPECIADLRDEILGYDFALRAVAALLKESSLGCFSDELYGEKMKHEAADLRWGLSQVIELCLDRQEKTLSDYADQYHNSDQYIVKRASDVINMIEHGAFNSIHASVERMRENIASLDIVINRDGELKSKALHLRDICQSYVAQHKVKKGNGA